LPLSSLGVAVGRLHLVIDSGFSDLDDWELLRELYRHGRGWTE
jgi:hypothetical protein